MEIRPAVARARSTGSALDRECLSLFHGFKATAAISGDPEPSFRKIHRDCRTWRLVCSLSSAPLRGLARPKLPTPGLRRGLHSGRRYLLVSAASSADPVCSFMANLEHASDDGRRLRTDHFF